LARPLSGSRSRRVPRGWALCLRWRIRPWPHWPPDQQISADLGRAGESVPDQVATPVRSAGAPRRHLVLVPASNQHGPMVSAAPISRWPEKAISRVLAEAFLVWTETTWVLMPSARPRHFTRASVNADGPAGAASGRELRRHLDGLRHKPPGIPGDHPRLLPAISGTQSGISGHDRPYLPGGRLPVGPRDDGTYRTGGVPGMRAAR
jgi:hypothetical protein